MAGFPLPTVSFSLQPATDLLLQVDKYLVGLPMLKL